MRPTFLGFEAAKSAVFANQKSIDITLNNLANQSTNGYTRQRVDRASIAHTAYSSRISGGRVSLAGQGVEALGVSQTRDSFLDKRFRDEFSKASYHGQSANILSDIQSAFDGGDITDEAGLYSAIAQISASLNDYGNSPTTDTESNLVMSAFKNMTQVLQQLEAKLTNVANQHIADTKITVDRTNEILQQVANLNKMISQDALVMTDPDNEYYRPNELMDQRNLLLDELASYGDISITQLQSGVVDVTMGGKKVVDGTTADALAVLVNNEGARDQTVSIYWRSTGNNATLGGGTLKASVEYINGRGHNTQNNTETTEQGVLYYRDRLDTFAVAMTKMVNNAIPEYDPLTDKPKVDPKTGEIIYKKLLGGKDSEGKTNGNGTVTAENISISDEWSSNGPGYFIYNSSREDSWNYAQKIMIALSDGSSEFNSYGEKFTGSFANYVVDFVGKVGADLAFSEGRQGASAKVADDFLDRRDKISGVSKDEETADMLMYQKSYEAAARMMTVLDELLDVVINRMGRVGL